MGLHTFQCLIMVKLYKLARDVYRNIISAPLCPPPPPLVSHFFSFFSPLCLSLLPSLSPPSSFLYPLPPSLLSFFPLSSLSSLPSSLPPSSLSPLPSLPSFPPLTLPSPSPLPPRNGVLKVGDRILKVNGHDVSKASQLETLSLLKTSEDNCTLKIEYDVTLHGETILSPPSQPLYSLTSYTLMATCVPHSAYHIAGNFQGRNFHEFRGFAKVFSAKFGPATSFGGTSKQFT